VNGHFAHEDLKVYQKAVGLAAWTADLLRSSPGSGSLRNQLERAASNITLNIAEGNGKSSKNDRTRFLEIARGSALECAACLDLLAAMSDVGEGTVRAGKTMLSEIVAMLTGLAGSLADRAREEEGGYSMERDDKRPKKEEEREKEKGLQVHIKRTPNSTDLPLPRYQSAGASGMDLHAAVEGEMVIEPGKVALVPTGLHIAVPRGYEAQVRPRSGLALKNMISVLNAPGTVDSDYRNEVGVILANFGSEPFTIKRGMRIAQMVICRAYQAELVEVEELDETDRQLGGFGSTGLH
jgi:dUTP pyrophosphatase